MANHVRQQIREAVAGAVTGLATTGSRVFMSRVYPLENADLPGLLVFSESETSAVDLIHPHPNVDRVLSLHVVGVAKAVADLDDTLDLISKEVETAVANAVSSFTALKTLLALTSTQIEMQGTAEQPVGTISMTYEAKYVTADNAPDVAL